MVVAVENASADTRESGPSSPSLYRNPGITSRPVRGPRANWMPWTELLVQPVHPSGLGRAFLGDGSDQVRPWSVLFASQKRPSVLA